MLWTDFETYLETLHAFEDNYLKEFWQRVLGRASHTTLVQAPPYANLAIGSSPNQSSTCVWSKCADPKDEAKGAITGKHTGADGFHTDCEESPWWETDLGRPHRLFEIRVFNSLKTAEKAQRAYRVAIDISQDGEVWTNVLTKDNDTPYGGVDGRPLRLPLPAGPIARYVKIRQIRRDFLNLDQIEIYGV